jgi:hypothetical protein
MACHVVLQVKEMLTSNQLAAYIFDRHILQYWIGHDEQVSGFVWNLVV